MHIGNYDLLKQNQIEQYQPNYVSKYNETTKGHQNKEVIALNVIL